MKDLSDLKSFMLIMKSFININKPKKKKTKVRKVLVGETRISFIVLCRGSMLEVKLLHVVIVCNPLMIQGFISQ